MELYERVKALARALAGSDKALAEMLALKQNTFSGYLKAEREDNLWPLLPRILALFPLVSRDWLYFGDGPMTIGPGAPPACAPDQPVPAKMAADAEQSARRDLAEQVAELTGQLRERDTALAEMRAKLADTEAELKDAYRANQKLTTKLLFDDTLEGGSLQNAAGKAANGLE